MSDLKTVKEFMRKEFPQVSLEIEAVGERKAKIRKPIENENLRPGGTVSGPTMMALADAAIYVAIFGELGIVALAVTTNFTINFLSKPEADKDIIAECHLVKVGKKLVVGEVTIYSEGTEDPVAVAVGTYSIPPQK